MNLEIGNNGRRMDGWKTMDIVNHGETDYVADLEKGIPLEDGGCQTVYLSHVLEHIPWFKTVDVLKEIYRVLEKGGWIEVHVPDAGKVFTGALMNSNGKDDWWHENPDHDINLWVNGRIFSYGPDENWHKALFTGPHLIACLKKAGFAKPAPCTPRYDAHGWINLGLRAQKL